MKRRVKDFEVARLGAIRQRPWKGLLSPLLLDRSESDVDLAVVPYIPYCPVMLGVTRAEG